MRRMHPDMPQAEVDARARRAGEGAVADAISFQHPDRNDPRDYAGIYGGYERDVRVSRGETPLRTAALPEMPAAATPARLRPAELPEMPAPTHPSELPDMRTLDPRRRGEVAPLRPAVLADMPATEAPARLRPAELPDMPEAAVPARLRPAELPDMPATAGPMPVHDPASHSPTAASNPTAAPAAAHEPPGASASSAAEPTPTAHPSPERELTPGEQAATEATPTRPGESEPTRSTSPTEERRQITDERSALSRERADLDPGAVRRRFDAQDGELAAQLRALPRTAENGATRTRIIEQRQNLAAERDAAVRAAESGGSARRQQINERLEQLNQRSREVVAGPQGALDAAALPVTASGTFQHPEGLPRAEAERLLERVNFDVHSGVEGDTAAVRQRQIARIRDTLPEHLTPIQAEVLQHLVDRGTPVHLTTGEGGSSVGQRMAGGEEIGGQINLNADNPGTRSAADTLLHEGGHVQTQTTSREGAAGLENQHLTSRPGEQPAHLLSELQADLRASGTHEGAVQTVGTTYPDELPAMAQRAPGFADLSARQKFVFLSRLVQLEPRATFGDVSDATIAAGFEAARAPVAATPPGGVVQR